MSRNSCASACRIAVVISLICLLDTSLRAQNARNPAGELNPVAQQQLDLILQQWHASSVQIRELNGEHRRYVYDYVFGEARQAMGRFYYKSPDSGRIDLTPNTKDQGKKISKLNPATNKRVQLTVKPDQPERWICDGTQVLQIDESTKTVQQFPIPLESRGTNIMDGPLPFLFGMPPEKAKARYELAIISQDKNWIDLLVKPRLKHDAANYRWARVKIERATMLPAAVQMIDPAGTKETVYTFPKIEKNPKPGFLKRVKWWTDKDPFKPNLKGYDVQAAATEIAQPRRPRTTIGPQPIGPQPQPAEKIVPSVVGLDYLEAQKLLQRVGYEVKFQKGDPAVRRELVYRVQNQVPREKTAAKLGTVVWLTLYTSAIQQTGGTVPAVSRPTVPKVTGLPFRAAEKILRDDGYGVKFRRGVAARQAKEIFTTYDQIPAAGAELNKGQDVILILFTKPAAAQPKTTN
jgi:TIGR03009 family protein